MNLTKQELLYAVANLKSGESFEVSNISFDRVKKIIRDIEGVQLTRVISIDFERSLFGLTPKFISKARINK